jgi:hypothetical protein
MYACFLRLCIARTICLAALSGGHNEQPPDHRGQWAIGFLPELYDALFPAEAHVPFYIDLARHQAGGVLDLACGASP